MSRDNCLFIIAMFVTGVFFRKATGDLFVVLGIGGFMCMVFGSILQEGEPKQTPKAPPSVPDCQIKEGEIHINPATLSKPKK